MNRKHSKKPQPILIYDELLLFLESSFPNNGRLECRFLWIENDISRYRANWYAKQLTRYGLTEYISSSLFIRVYKDGEIQIVRTKPNEGLIFG